MRFFVSITALFVLLVAGACSQQNQEMNNSSMTIVPQPAKAICVLMPTADGNVHGLVTFEKVTGGIKVTAEVTGLPPGKHGFHIHEFGDCSALDYKSAGSHLMAEGEMHAGPDNPNRHVGDMGNLMADSAGNAHLTLVDAKLSFTGPQGVIGKAIIVHEGEDDLTTQPTGNAGGRAACGTIGLAKQ